MDIHAPDRSPWLREGRPRGRRRKYGGDGPAGPGDLLRAQKVLAGTDPVALDAYCAGLHKLKPQDLLMLTKAVAARIGRVDIDKLNVKELEG